MKTEKVITLCAVVAALTSCQDKEVQQVEKQLEKAPIRRVIEEVDLPSKLKNLLTSSYYSSAKLIEATLPKLLGCIKEYPYENLNYIYGRFGTDSYKFFDEFTDNERQKYRFVFEYSPSNNEIKIEFYDEGRDIYTTFNLSNGRLDIKQQGYDEIKKEYVTKTPDDVNKWKERHNQFLKWMYERLTTICGDNPYANKATTVEEFEEAVEKTTKTTIVMTTANWCAPCYYFKRWEFNPFLRNNRNKYDVIIADMDPNHDEFVETNEELETYFQKRFGNKGSSLPTLFFLDKYHKHIGNYTDGNSDEFRWKVRDIVNQPNN
ncbi:hypothetical protein HY636_00440 [Candidatus Woesearchaeota archaeon]|nr:hypothetical protein [Candidatus Woesearchaeota archaeon]